MELSTRGAILWRNYKLHRRPGREIVLPMEGQNRCKVFVEDDSSHNGIVSVWKEQNASLDSHSQDSTLFGLEHDVYLLLPACSMDRASRDTEIFSSEFLTQSSMPLQPFTGKVKLELVVVGRLWMLSTERGRESFFWSTSTRTPRTFWCCVCVLARLIITTMSCENVTLAEPKRSHKSQ